MRFAILSSRYVGYHGPSFTVMSLATLSMLSFLVCASWSTTVHAEPVSVTADGMAVLRNGIVPETRNTAISEALKEAVRQVVGLMVESTTLVENAQLVADRIETKTNGYVMSYRVLGERQETSLYRVTVEATVDRTHLSQDLESLGLLYRRVGNPRFVVLVNDSFAGAAVPDVITEAEIGRLLITRGFEVVDQMQVSAIRQGEQARQLLKGSSKAAQALGQQLGADVLIVGEASGAVAMRGGALGAMVSVRSNLQAKAIRVDTGVVLCSEVVTAAGIDLSEVVALRKSLGSVAGRWVDAGLPTLIDRWTKESGGENVVLLTMRGLTFDQADQFIRMMRTKIAGITGVRSRSYSDKEALVEVMGMATGEALGRDLRRSDLQPYQLEISSVSAHRIEAQVRAR